MPTPVLRPVDSRTYAVVVVRIRWSAGPATGGFVRCGAIGTAIPPEAAIQLGKRSRVTLNTIALELVPPNVDGGLEKAPKTRRKWCVTRQSRVLPAASGT